MLSRVLCAVAVAALAAGVAVAAGPIKVPLADFKMKPKFDTTPADLLGYNEAEGKLFFLAHGTATADVKIPADGEYTITVEASCDEAKNEKARFQLKVGDKVVAKSFELKSVDPKEYTFTAKLKKGDAKLSIEFLNDEFKEGEFDRNLYVHAVRFEEKKK